jgi:hypothetical protein
MSLFVKNSVLMFFTCNFSFFMRSGDKKHKHKIMFGFNISDTEHMHDKSMFFSSIVKTLQVLQLGDPNAI